MKKAYSWPIIIILLILFFPVGFYLIYKRFTYDKTATASNQKGLSVTGWIFIGIAIIYFILGISGQMKTEDGQSEYMVAIIMPLIFVPLGIVFLSTARKFKRMGKMYKKYITVIIRQKQHIIENIASAVGVSYEQAIIDLQEMLNAGYFPDAYIDGRNYEFVLPTNNQVAHAHQVNNSTMKTKVVKCQNCGANNTVLIERANVCEYCGSPI